ncbi:hypothetical protein EDC01DRAFT_679282 [Geopyxis carbonaria]|nr:hypothetical protein EDC01DRAFT_679282 [Geopyxis carbonaria]
MHPWLNLISQGITLVFNSAATDEYNPSPCMHRPSHLFLGPFSSSPLSPSSMVTSICSYQQPFSSDFEPACIVNEYYTFGLREAKLADRLHHMCTYTSFMNLEKVQIT